MASDGRGGEGVLVRNPSLAKAGGVM